METIEKTYATVEDRRKTPRQASNIKKILDQMQDMADERHSGDLQGNVLSIFSQLPSADKKTFLRKSLMLHWENFIAEETEDIEFSGVKINAEDVRLERENINELNAREQLKLKSWLTKAAAILATIAFLTMGALTVGMEIDKNDPAPLMEQIKQVWAILVGR